jgi:hypothetical protein
LTGAATRGAGKKYAEQETGGPESPMEVGRDDIHLDVRVSLGERAANAARQEPVVVVIVHNDGDKWRSHIKILKYKDIFDVGPPQRAEFSANSLRARNLLLAPLRRDATATSNDPADLLILRCRLVFRQQKCSIAARAAPRTMTDCHE